MELNNFDSFNTYCGPAVLSIFTGARADDCADEIQKVNKAFKVKGVYAQDLITAGTSMGLEFIEIPSFQGRSLFFAGSVLIKMPPCQYLVTVPRHFVALETKDASLFICDNHTKKEIELQNSARLSQKIERVWKVTKVREYEKPHVVTTEYAVVQDGLNISIRLIQTLSDGGVKINPLGQFKVMSPEGLQEVAFALMRLGDK